MPRQRSKSCDCSISTTGTLSSDNTEGWQYLSLNLVRKSEASHKCNEPVDYQNYQNINFVRQQQYQQQYQYQQQPNRYEHQEQSHGYKHQYQQQSHRFEHQYQQQYQYQYPHRQPTLIRPPSSNKIFSPSASVPEEDSDDQLQKIALNKSLIEMGFKTNEIDGWQYILQPLKNDLYKLLRNMISNHIKPNVQIRIGTINFKCHMIVLQCYSEFFMEFDNEILVQLPEENITPSAFMMVYDWMLADAPLVQREGILELFNAANFLRIKELVNQCWLCLDDDERFCEDTAFLLYLEARQYGLENLEQLMLTRICKFFLTLVASRDFLSLTANEVIMLLNSNTLGVNSEIEIFMTAVRWLNFDWEEREQYLLDIMSTVRFNLIPPWFLVTLTQKTGCVEVDRVLLLPEVKKMISDGITYSTTELYYGENREQFLSFLKRYDLVAPVHRQWVFDKECSYHHRLECPNMQYITYKDFLEYLEKIQSNGKDYWRNLEMANSTKKGAECCNSSDDGQAADTNFKIQKILRKKKSRDQGIQCENALNSYRKNFLSDGGSKLQSRHGSGSMKSVQKQSTHGHSKHSGMTECMAVPESDYCETNAEQALNKHLQQQQSQKNCQVMKEKMHDSKQQVSKEEAYCEAEECKKGNNVTNKHKSNTRNVVVKSKSDNHVQQPNLQNRRQQNQKEQNDLKQQVNKKEEYYEVEDYEKLKIDPSKHKNTTRNIVAKVRSDSHVQHRRQHHQKEQHDLKQQVNKEEKYHAGEDYNQNNNDTIKRKNNTRNIVAKDKNEKNVQQQNLHHRREHHQEEQHDMKQQVNKGEEYHEVENYNQNNNDTIKRKNNTRNIVVKDKNEKNIQQQNLDHRRQHYQEEQQYRLASTCETKQLPYESIKNDKRLLEIYKTNPTFTVQNNQTLNDTSPPDDISNSNKCNEFDINIESYKEDDQSTLDVECSIEIESDTEDYAEIELYNRTNKGYFKAHQQLLTTNCQLSQKLDSCKLIVIGGIDPYCAHCQHEHQLQQQHHHQRLQPHRKKAFAVDNSTSFAIGTNSLLMPMSVSTTTMAHNACALSSPINPISSINYNNNNNNSNNKLQQTGDQVLLYEIAGANMAWRHLSHIPLGSRHHHGAVLCNGLIYVIGGTKTALGCTKKSIFEKSVWCFNPNTLKWVFECSLPESRRDFAVVAINEEAKCMQCKEAKDHRMPDIGFFIIGGEGLNGEALNTVWFYSVLRKLWLRKAPLNTGRYGLAAAMVNNEIWIAGGIINDYSNNPNLDWDIAAGSGDGVRHTITDTIEIYSLKCPHASIKCPRNDTLTNYEINHEVDNVHYVSQIERGAGDGDCRTDQWIKSNLRLRKPRLFGKLCKMANDDLFLIGGIGVNESGVPSSLAAIDVFNFEQHVWRHVGNLKWARHGHDVAIINDHCIVVVGGVSTIEKCTLKTVEVFCTETCKSLNNLTELPLPVSGCAIIALK